jgi:hypothetical protein
MPSEAEYQRRLREAQALNGQQSDEINRLREVLSLSFYALRISFTCTWGCR